MLRNFPNILGVASFALAVAICLLATSGAGKAQDFPATHDTAPICQAY